MAILSKEIINKAEWETFLTTRPEANFLHSWYWGEFHKALKKSIHRFGFYDNEKLVGVMLLVVEKSRRAIYVTVPAGPIIDWHNDQVVAAILATMKEVAHKEQAAFVRVRPQIEDTSETRALFSRLGFRGAPSHLHAELTSQLDITLDEEALMANMRKQTRAEIRKGIKEGITVSQTTDPNAIRPFYDVQCETAKRQGFVPFSYEFLHEQFKIFTESGHAVLYTATLGSDVLAYAFIIFYGTESAYHYGASTEAGRKHPGAYMIQWEAIREAKRRGIKVHNFWGVAPLGQIKHRFYPISIFKRGFGGKDFAYLHAHDLVIRPLAYVKNFIIEYVRNRLRRL